MLGCPPPPCPPPAPASAAARSCSALRGRGSSCACAGVLTGKPRSSALRHSTPVCRTPLSPRAPLHLHSAVSSLAKALQCNTIHLKSMCASAAVVGPCFRRSKAHITPVAVLLTFPGPSPCARTTRPHRSCAARTARRQRGRARAPIALCLCQRARRRRALWPRLAPRPPAHPAACAHPSLPSVVKQVAVVGVFATPRQAPLTTQWLAAARERHMWQNGHHAEQGESRAAKQGTSRARQGPAACCLLLPAVNPLPCASPELQA